MSTVIEKPATDPAAPPAPPATPVPAPEPKPPEPSPATPPVVPPADIVYDVRLARDSPLDAKADVDKVVAFAKAHKLSNEQAQALVKDVIEDVGVRLVAAQQQTALQRIEAAKQTFLEEAQKDPVIGGAKLEETTRDVERALNWLAVRLPDEVKRFRAEIGATPYGNYPPYLKMFALIGRAVAPDQTPIFPGATGSGPAPKTLKEALYGPTKTG